MRWLTYSAAPSGRGIDLDGEYTAAYKVPLYRPKFHRDGERKDHKYGRKQIGEMLLCLDWNSYVYGAIEFANFIPALFEVTIDGRTFLAQGGGFHPLGGSMSLNYVYDSGDPDDLDDAFEDDALGLIRLYVPEEE